MTTTTTTEDCPVCLNEMNQADTTFPLKCPTATCHFNVCLDCIKNMEKSAADDYVEASDGSNQVKFHVRRYKFILFPPSDSNITREIVLSPGSIKFLAEDNNW